jgi:hypothetical protein
MCVASVPTAQAEVLVDFNRDVRPILSDKCYACHGPDANTREKGLRLDTREGLFGAIKSGAAVVAPGAPDQSALFGRVTHPDVNERMPPEEMPRQLTEADVETLRQWITQGAAWDGHWAFIPPAKPDLPQVSNPGWCRSGIDSFILNRLDAAGLAPAPEADKATLIRRVSLDLTGLPPTPEEVDAFVADDSSDAYEKVVDRLLASPHYGERMAFVWLDAARYADTNGYQRDTKRDMWAWRDWVIQAFNDNMPFDQFTIEQLAGDLMPDPTRSQKVATGFNRNHRINGEGGIIPEEYAVEYVVDRVATTSTTWMGLSMGCARCHEHKFDPFSQKEFYELYAFFNQVPEQGKGGEKGNDEPYLAIPTQEQLAAREEVTARIAAFKRTLLEPNERLDTLQLDWEQMLREKFAALQWKPVEAMTATAVNGAELTTTADGTFVAGGENPPQETYTIEFDAQEAIRTFRLEVLTDDALPETGPGRSPNGNVVLSNVVVERAVAASPTTFEPLPFAGALADHAQKDGNYSIENSIDDDPASGWATGSHQRRENRTAVFVLGSESGIQPGDRVRITLDQSSESDQHTMGRFRLSHSGSGDLLNWAQPEFSPWRYLGPFYYPDTESKELLGLALPVEEEAFDQAATYGTEERGWIEQPEWADGTVIDFRDTNRGFHYVHRSFRVELPTKLVLSLGSNDAIKVWLNGEVEFENNVARGTEPDQDRLPLYLQEGEYDLLFKVANYGNASGFYFKAFDDDGEALLTLIAQMETSEEARTEENRRRLRNLFRGQDAEWVAQSEQVKELEAELEALNKDVPSTMIMASLDEPRDTYLLNRGEYNAPDTSEQLYPSTPVALGEMDEALPKNRLGFARWLMDPEHPLTARVRVNHYWQMYFGSGLVKTSEDFGSQGSPPSHPELLDWLATEFVESGWDVKGMQKRIVMSATYRQNSVYTELHRQADPENILLARAPRFRLSAEMIRDQALSVSGLLSPALGGPSVKPYQPDKMWSSLTFQNMDEYDTNFYRADTGDALYRRGLYTYWKRTIAPPRMQIFDAPDRERCSLRQDRTNTPMQAMVLLNDPTFVEASRSLAQRMIQEGGDRSSDRVSYGYKLALATRPDTDRANILLAGLSDYQAHFNQNREDAEALVALGDSEPDAAIDQAELAAYTMLASVILNLDEMITRE